VARHPGSSVVRRKYELIKSNQKEHRIQMMCRLLGVAPSGHYAGVPAGFHESGLRLNPRTGSTSSAT